MNKRITLSRAVLATALCAANTAIAAETEERLETVEVTGEQGASYLADDMDTATGLGLSVLETPQSVSQISRALMDDFEIDSLNEALETSPGIMVESVETDRTYYTARGFDVTNFQLDGVGVPATYGNSNGEIDTAIFDRIEIVRGAGGLMAGAGNPSATINLVRKRPTDDFNLQLGATTGSWDRKRLDADVSGSLADNIRGRFVVAGEDRESYLDRYGMQKNVAYGVVDWSLGTSTTATAGISYQESNADSPLWGALPMHYTDGTQTDYDVSASTSAEWSYWNNTDTTAFAELVHGFANGWEVKAYYTHSEVEGDSELFYQYSLPDSETDIGLIGYASEYGLEESRDLLDLRLFGSFQFVGRDHDVVIGYNWAEGSVEDYSLYDYTNGFPAIGDFTQWDGVTPARPVFTDGLSGSDWTDRQQSLYAATRLRLADSLSVIAGARVTDWKSDGESYGEDHGARASGEVLPYAGLVYTISDAVSAYASHTETFMPNRDIGADLKRLKPAEGSNDELGIKASLLDGKLVASAAVFRAGHLNVSESAYFDADLGVTIYEGRDYESQGYEVELVGQLSEGLQASLGYTELEIEDSDGNEARNFIPKRVLRAYANYQVPTMPRLKVGAGVNWQDDIERITAYGVTVRQQSYANVSAFASYAVNDNLSLALNVANLTDEKYINSLYWDQAFYGAPRNFSASVNWRY
ncbi:TonB-dependent siderophore receptor [Microbulbifer guangxiensis]|uniref:TonB-dependent siderophore receptor n=1 Tax=Microbulbifer guangxiensis TaxID=2904249 RepID=UPI001F02BA81|nr:TonB-dependent siderophore receptor [Microbulbifer guangxiensis]